MNSHVFRQVSMRGFLLHMLLPKLLAERDWSHLAEMDLVRLAEMISQEVDVFSQRRRGRNFYTLRCGDALWIAKCFKRFGIFLKDELQVRGDIVIEPVLPTILLPHGDLLSCGVPDLFVYSETLEGFVNIEVKSGFGKRRMSFGKTLLYNEGTWLKLMDEEAIHVPFKGTVWVSFSDGENPYGENEDAPSATEPLFTYDTHLYNPRWADRVLWRWYGIGSADLWVFPRQYDNTPSLLGF